MTPISKVTPAATPAEPAPPLKLDAVAAKAVLDKFAESFKAARDLGDALETAVQYERHQMELKNNLEHLEKQQREQMEAFATQQRDAQATATAQKARLATELGAIQAEIRTTAERSRLEQDYARRKQAEAQVQFDAFTQQAAAAMNEIERDKAAKQAELTAMEKRITEAKDKMKVFLA